MSNFFSFSSVRDLRAGSNLQIFQSLVAAISLHSVYVGHEGENFSSYITFLLDRNNEEYIVIITEQSPICAYILLTLNKETLNQCLRIFL
jgi:hypothetical protein